MYDGRQINQNNYDDDISNHEHVNNDSDKVIFDDNLALVLEKKINEKVDEKLLEKFKEFDDRLQNLDTNRVNPSDDILYLVREITRLHNSSYRLLNHIYYSSAALEDKIDATNKYLEQGIVSINILIVVLIIVIVINNFFGTIFKR